MQHLLLTIKPRSAFATPLKGDTLFGQLCWTLRDGLGEDRLQDLLQDYTKGRPFAVASDALLKHCWPRPMVPPALFGDVDVDPAQRKAANKRAWLRRSDFSRPIGEWLSCMMEAPDDTGSAAASGGTSGKDRRLKSPETRFRNSIDRRIGTTSDEGFAPYGVEQFWYREDICLDCHIVYDPDRIDADTLRQAMKDIGALGFGRDATVGLGRFEVETFESAVLPLSQEGANSWLTLAPVAPQGLAWNPDRCWYRPFTRFGRHGNAAVPLGHPFKTPVLLADTGAVLTPGSRHAARLFVGRGLGGAGRPLSRSIPETVHQGYAPVIGIRVPEDPDGGNTES